MSLYVDLKFVNLISNRLLLFKRKEDYLFNFRCPICGDSQKNKNRARGYFYRKGTGLSMKCHNCNASMHFGSFLKDFDSNLYKEYLLERYTNTVVKPKKEEPVIPPKSKRLDNMLKPKNLLDMLLDNLASLPDDNEAVQFCLKRGLDRKWFDSLYYIDDVRKIVQLSPKYKDKVVTDEPRLVIPFYDERKKLVGVTLRALRGETLRYITVRIDEDSPMVFNLDAINKHDTIYVVEGPIDSMFLPNAIAVGGTGFTKLSGLNLPKDKMTVIIDNQPRNKEVVDVVRRVVKMGYRVFFWPAKYKEKDINDMVLGGLSGDSLRKMIDENSFSGLEAQVKFLAWKKI